MRGTAPRGNGDTLSCHGTITVSAHIVFDTTYHDGETPSLVSLKLWSDVPESTHEELVELTKKFCAVHPGLDVHIEVYMLREETRQLLEKVR